MSFCAARIRMGRLWVLALSTVVGTSLHARDVSAADGGLLMYAQERIYRVTITTSLDIPAGSKISRVQVSHGLPIERPWSEGEHKSSARNIFFEPGKGEVEFDRESGSSYITWEERVSSKGGLMAFTTTYETTSVARDVGPEGAARAKWKSRRVRVESDMHPEIVEQAKILIKEPSPVEAMKKFSEWLVTRVVGDASVVNTCVDDTMRNGAGHCGHRAAVLRQFAKALGIESRYIGGSSLNFEDGGTEKPLFQLNPTWSNNHAWMELDIPGLGWLEVEPAGKDKMFAVPVHYVQTRGNFQNYQVLVMQGGKWIKPEWETVSENGSNRFVSNIGLRNVIKFEVLRSSETESEGSAKAAQLLEAAPPNAASTPTDNPG